MSNPGIMMTPQTEQQKRQQMALILLQQGMQGQAMQANPSSPYAGSTNAAGNIVNAFNYRNIQQENDPLGPVKSTPMRNSYGALGRLFGFGGV